MPAKSVSFDVRIVQRLRLHLPLRRDMAGANPRSEAQRPVELGSGLRLSAPATQTATATGDDPFTVRPASSMRLERSIDCETEAEQVQHGQEDLGISEIELEKACYSQPERHPDPGIGEKPGRAILAGYDRAFPKDDARRRT